MNMNKLFFSLLFLIISATSSYAMASKKDTQIMEEQRQMTIIEEVRPYVQCEVLYENARKIFEGILANENSDVADRKLANEWVDNYRILHETFKILANENFIEYARSKGVNETLLHMMIGVYRNQMEITFKELLKDRTSVQLNAYDSGCRNLLKKSQ